LGGFEEEEGGGQAGEGIRQGRGEASMKKG